MNNGTVHVVSTIIHNVMSLSAKDDIAVLYLNTKDDVVIWNTLEYMGHSQPETPLWTENSTA